MADRVITAEMVIAGRDGGASDMLAKIAGRLDMVAKAASHSDKVQALGKAFGALEGQMKAFDKLNGAQKTLTVFQDRVATAAANVTRLETAMASVEKPSARMITSITAAHAALDKATGAATRQTTALRAAETAVAAMGHPVDRAAVAQERLRRDMDLTTSAIEKQMLADRRAQEVAKMGAVVDRERATADHRRQHLAAHSGVGHLAATAAAGYVSAHGVLSLAEKSYEAGSEYQHELVGLQNTGRTPAQIAAITKAAADAAQKVPTSTFIENMATVKETTEAFGSVEHAMSHLAFLQKATSVLHASAGNKVEGGSAQIGKALAKYYEERMRPPEEFESEISAMIPAMVASGGQFNPQNLYMFAQGAKSALPGYSVEFMRDYAPSLIARNGERAGTSAFAFDSVISGKARDKKQAQEWVRLGLLNPHQVIEGKDGPIGWKAGAVKGTRLASENPVEWAEKVLIPAMKAKGVNTEDRLAVKTELATLFRNGMSNFFATEITQQQSLHLLHKNAALNKAVGSTDEIYQRNLTTDPKVAMQGLEAAFTNLITTASSPAMETAAKGITWVAGELNHLALVAKDHPTAALATGGGLLAGGLGVSGMLTARLLGGGFGLRSSAVALDAAAEHLMMVGGGSGGVAREAVKDAAKIGGPSLLPTLAIPEGVTLGAAGLAIGGALAATELVKRSFAAQAPGMGGQWAAATAPTEGLDKARLADQVAEAEALKRQIAGNAARSKLPDAAAMLNGPLQDKLAEKENQIEALKVSLDGLHPAVLPATSPMPPSRPFTPVPAFDHAAEAREKAAARDAAIHRTERQRLMRHPLEDGLDRMRAEMTGENAPLPPTRPFTPTPPSPYVDREAERGRAMDRPMSISSAILALTEAARRIQAYEDDRATRSRDIGGPPRQFDAAAPATMRPADADDRAAERADAIRKFNEDLGLSGFVMGQLNDKTGIVLTAFDGLGGNSGTLGGSMGSLAGAAGLAAEKLLALANFDGAGSAGAGGPGGGAGVIKASYDGEGIGDNAGGVGNTARSKLPDAATRGGEHHEAMVTTTMPSAGSPGVHGSVPGAPNPYAGGNGAGAFVPPVGDHLTAGMRNNNLGNIGYFGQHTAGLIGPSNARDVDHPIAKFDTQESGIRAAAALALAKYHGGRHNSWDIIAAKGGWTPGKLGPDASISVAKAMGLGNRDDLHLDDPDRMVKFLHGLAVQEHGPAGRFYGEDSIRGALGHHQMPQEHRTLRPDAPRLGPRPEVQPNMTTAAIHGKLDRIADAIESGGSLHRIELKTDKGVTAKRVYSRGSPGPTMA